MGRSTTYSPTQSGAFQIRPLRWKRERSDNLELHGAYVPMGSYAVRRSRDEPGEPWGPWHWGYTFDEYYDELEAECASLKDGKQKAWEDWVKRLLPALVPTHAIEVEGRCA